VLSLERPSATSDAADALGREVADLRRRVAALTALLRVVFAVLRGSGLRLAGKRLPEGDGKLRIVVAIVKAQEVMPLRKILHPIGLSASRFHAWKRTSNGCGLEGQSTCPKISPHQLLPEEVGTIREMVLSEEYRHVPTGILADVRPTFMIGRHQCVSSPILSSGASSSRLWFFSSSGVLPLRKRSAS
jgi:hypothetical protein